MNMKQSDIGRMATDPNFEAAERKRKEHEARFLSALGHDLCGHRGFSGPTACILERGHEGGHKYGDVQEAQIRSLRQQLAGANARIEAMGETALNQQKQIVMLREALRASANYIDTLGGTSTGLRQTLAATSDLDRLILCEREVVGIADKSDAGIMWLAAIEDGTELYRAWRPE